MLALLPVLLVAAQDEEPRTPAWPPGLEANVYADMLATRDSVQRLDEDGDPIDDRARLRKASLEVLGPLAEEARAVVLFSFDQVADNDSEAELDEAFVEMDDPFGIGGAGESAWSFGVRLGKFRSSFGHANQDRLYDMPQPTRPAALRNFLGDDGFTQTGVGLVLGFPTGPDHDLTFTAEAIDSGDIPVAEVTDGQAFSSVGSLDWTWRTAPGERFTAGLSSYRGPKFSPRTHMLGADLAFESEGAGDASAWLLAGEAYHAWVEETGVPRRTPGGFFVMAQRQIARTWYAGARIERFDDLVTGNQGTDVYGAYLTKAVSDTLRMALGYEHEDSEVVGREDSESILFQVDFALGTDPRRPRWLGHDG